MFFLCLYNRIPEVWEFIKKRVLLSSWFWWRKSPRAWHFHLPSFWWGPCAVSQWGGETSGTGAQRHAGEPGTCFQEHIHSHESENLSLSLDSFNLFPRAVLPWSKHFPLGPISQHCHTRNQIPTWALSGVNQVKP